MKVKPGKIDGKERMKYLDTLYTAVAGLSSREEIKSFLRDLLTESERIMLGRRILIAQMLLQDKSYDEIIRVLRVGIDTISRVHRWLHDESNGYKKAVKELEKVWGKRLAKMSNREADPGYDRFSFRGLKRRYPLHFFLFNLLDKISKD